MISGFIRYPVGVTELARVLRVRYAIAIVIVPVSIIDQMDHEGLGRRGLLVELKLPRRSIKGLVLVYVLEGRGVYVQVDFLDSSFE